MSGRDRKSVVDAIHEAAHKLHQEPPIPLRSDGTIDVDRYLAESDQVFRKILVTEAELLAEWMKTGEVPTAQ